MYKAVFQLFLFCLIVTAAFSAAQAQSLVLDLPLRSQYAEVTQRIGVTTITIKYSRPLVNERKIWGGLVPYGKVWRTGANTNTTISFSDPVIIQGKPLERGTYGLHTIPNDGEWTIIFSKNSTSWGSFTYDQAEDALRVNVKPKPADVHNALTFEFDDLQPNRATVALKWEKIEVPFTVAVDVREAVRASLRKQFRTLSRYTWISWNDAANYLLAEKIDLNDALAYAEKSIENEDRFENEITKSKVLTALNRQSEAAAVQKKALDLGTPLQVHQFARELLAAKRSDEAFAIFRENAKKHPDKWFVHEGLARMYSAQGRFDDAKKEIRAALAIAPVNQKSDLNESLKELESGRDINQ
jgi:tetratricopeptide (TPR) repeat protein